MRRRLICLFAACALFLLFPIVPARSSGPTPAFGAPLVSSGPSASPVGCSIPSPWAPQTWFLGTGGGVFRRSVDDTSWVSVSKTLPIADVDALVAMPQQPGHLMVHLYSCTENSVYRSLDGGIHWDRCDGFPPGMHVSGLAADPFLLDVVYVATDSGIYRTTSFGDTWQLQGLPGHTVFDIACDPVHPGRIWASTRFQGPYGEGIYRSTDGGTTWTLSSNGIGGHKYFDDIRVGTSGDTLYAVGWEAYRSTDGGDSWTEMGPGRLSTVGSCREAALPHGTAHRVAVAKSDSVFLSSDAGNSWQSVRPPIDGDDWLNTLSSPDGGSGRVITGTAQGGVLYSTTGGADWIRWSRGVSTGQITALDLAGNRWLAGADNGIYLSEDAGQGWTRVGNPDYSVQILDLEFAGSDGMTAFCSTSNAFFAGDVFGTWDGGHTWFTLLQGDGRIEDLAIDGSDPERIYAVSNGETGTGLYRSTDGGASWTHDDVFGFVGVYALAVDPLQPQTVIAGTLDGLRRSSDYGIAWSPCGPPGVCVSDLCWDGPGRRLFAAAYDGGVLVSADHGLTWSPVGSGLPAGINTVNASCAAVGILVGTEAAGIWRYDGFAWSPLLAEDQQPCAKIWTIHANPQTSGVVVGTGGRGVWRDDAGPSDIVPRSVFPEDRLIVLGSPSSGPFVVQLASAGLRDRDLEVFDVAGRLLRLIASRTEPGVRPPEVTREWTWDGRTAWGTPVAPGLYFLRARSQTGLQSGRVWVIR